MDALNFISHSFTLKKKLKQYNFHFIDIDLSTTFIKKNGFIRD